MSAIKAVYEAALADLHNAAAKLEQIGHDGWARVKEIARELEGDEPVLAAEAEKDAANVVHTAETQGLVSAEQKAVADGTALVVEAGHDVATAVEGSAHTPAQTTAVIAGEATVADPGHNA